MAIDPVFMVPLLLNDSNGLEKSALDFKFVAFLWIFICLKHFVFL